MADLLPNLNDLLAALPDSGEGRDAAALACAAAIAPSWAEASERMETLVRQWGAR